MFGNCVLALVLVGLVTICYWMTRLGYLLLTLLLIFLNGR